MCGRFTLRTPSAAWTQEFLPLWTQDQRQARAAELDMPPRYNIAPTQPVACIHAGSGERRQWSLFRWGLIPPWADDTSIGNRMINARSETVAEKRSFKPALIKRRCLIPADGYYEWQKRGGGKQPYLIERTDGGMLAMAGLWERNAKLGEGDHPLCTCTILTTAANQATRAIHDRMPVFLDAESQARWLDPQRDDPDELTDLLQPAPDDWWTMRPVSRRVNSPRNESPECVEPVEEHEDD